MNERLLDVRDMEPPEPLERVLAEMETLQREERIRMIHRREPHLLFPMLAREQFAYEVTLTPGHEFHILIWRKPDAN